MPADLGLGPPWALVRLATVCGWVVTLTFQLWGEPIRKGIVEANSEGLIWGKVGGILAIFAVVFSLITFVFPVGGGMISKLMLTALVVSLTLLIYFGVAAALNDNLDMRLTVWTLITLVLGVAYAALVVSDRDATIADLERRVGPTVTIVATKTSEPTASTSGAQSSPPPTTSETPPTPPTSTTNTQSAPVLPPFDSSNVGVKSNGTVTLALGEYGLQLDTRWGSSDGYGGAPRSGNGSDVTFRESGLTGQEGTQFALLRAGARRSYPTCQAETSWVPSLNWDQVRRGTFICVKTPSGRRAMMRIDEMPNFDTERQRVQVTGVTWIPIVDR